MKTTNMNNANAAIENAASEFIYVATRVRTEVWELQCFHNLHNYISIRSYKTTTLNPDDEAVGLKFKGL